jgi:hypothetical protein
MRLLQGRCVRAVAVLALTGLIGCAPAPAPPPKPPPEPAPQQVEPPPAAPKPSSASAEARIRYARVQADLLARGLLRTDGGTDDAPFTDRMLADSFIRIALYDEYAPSGGALVQQTTASILRRWEQPVRVGLTFGASVPEDRRATDTARIASYLARLSRITGHPIRLSDGNPNFLLFIVNEDERRALGPVIQSALPSLSPGEVAGITRMDPNTYCLVYALSGSDGATYTRALAVIRSEHPDLMRLSCLHEELAQGLGLANDSPQARPSIFNDDEEFALLTPMDEYLLAMLYDPSLRPGMTEAEVRPIVYPLAARLLGGAS